MNIYDKISEDIKKAILSQNKEELMALRNIKKGLIDAKTSKEALGNITDDIAIKVISKLVKQNKDAAILFEEQKRNDLAQEYLLQTEVMQRYLPTQISEEELEFALNQIITSLGITSIKDMCKVIGIASKQLAGKAEGRRISEKVKQLLG